MARPTALGRAVDAWLTHLDVERGVSPNTMAAYRRDLSRWTAYLAGVGVDDPQDVTEAHVTAAARFTACPRAIHDSLPDTDARFTAFHDFTA